MPTYLRIAAIVYFVAMIVHILDHVRRGLDVLTPEVRWEGIISTMISLATIGLVFSRNRFAPRVALVVGLATGIGIIAVHLLPRWSVFSDPFPGSNVDIYSWAAVLLEMVSAFALAATAFIASLDSTASFRNNVSPHKESR